MGCPSFCQDMTMGSSPAVMEQRMERRWSCLRDWLGKPGDWRLGGAEGGQWERGASVIEMRMREEKEEEIHTNDLHTGSPGRGEPPSVDKKP